MKCIRCRRERRTYAKGMCKSCYSYTLPRRFCLCRSCEKKKRLYAKNKCKKCYMRIYKRKRREIDPQFKERDQRQCREWRRTHKRVYYKSKAMSDLRHLPKRDAKKVILEIIEERKINI